MICLVENEKMTELTKSFVGVFKENSLALALVYTFGHVIIAMSVVYWMTGASLFQAGLVALIEPSINGVWFYVLHKLWRRLNA
jgi:uncharacterized membrane protein